MSNQFNPTTGPGQPMVYQIRIKGHLGRHWTDWFEGLTITLEDNGETLLTGPVVDQAGEQRLAVVFQRDGQALKPVCPVAAQVPFDPDLIDHWLTWTSCWVELV